MSRGATARKPEASAPSATKKAAPVRLVPPGSALLDSRRMRFPVVVEGIEGPLDTRMLKPSEFAKVHVDDVTYQRSRTSIVLDIVAAIKAGGSIPAPIAIAIRPSGEWYLVDGLQRFSAAVDCEVAVHVTFYRSQGARSEAELYQLLNTRVGLTADNIVKSHQGPGADLLREVARDPGHALGGLVFFGGRGRRRRYISANIAIRGLLACATGTLASGKIQNICARLDYALKREPAARARLESFLRLLPLTAFPGDHAAKMLPVLALGRVAFAHWRLKVKGPSERSIRSIAGINWESLYKTSSVVWLPMVEAAIEKRWRE